MKKLLPVISFLFFLFSPVTVFASSSVSSTEQVSLTDILTDEVATANNISFEGSQDVTLSSQNYYALIGSTSNNFTLASGLNANSVYSLDLTVNMTITPSVAVDSMRLRSFHVYFDDFFVTTRSSVALPFEFTRGFTVTMTGQEAMSSYQMSTRAIATNTTAVSTFTLDFDYEIIVNSITALSDAESDDYTNGYNAGYSAGESAGYGAGYSDGYTTGNSEGYNSGYQAGIDSVDTVSYYDAGYQAGYADAYQSGYDDGFQNGWKSAMERFESWGADTTDYPVLMYESDVITAEGSIFLYDINYNASATVTKPIHYHYFDFEPNPDHTYKVSFDLPLNSSSFNTSYYYYSGITYYLNFSGMDLYGDNSVFIPGSRMGDKVTAMATVQNLTNKLSESSASSISVDVGYNFSYSIYDYGPTNGTQNHIANQTDELMNTAPDNNDKYNSDLDSFNSELDSGISFEEDIMTEQNENISNFEYKPLSDFTGLASALSFYSAVVTSAFSSLGDFQGLWVISLTIIVIMVLLRISRRA